MEPHYIKDIKDLDIVVYISPVCHSCNKVINYLSDNKLLNYVTLFNVDEFSDEDKIKFNNMPVPCFLSRKTSKISVGYKPIDEMIKDFQRDPQDVWYDYTPKWIKDWWNNK